MVGSHSCRLRSLGTLIKLMQSKAVEVLRNMPLAKAMDAIQTLNIAMRQERLVFGEPSERTAVSVEDTIRREYERWMTVEEDAAEDSTG